ncbi:MAG: 50S ribosomal protein L9, partial [Anaerolineae bacterium]|nr:50S ribosomal protein L9 [Anaerolineae bacterium]
PERACEMKVLLIKDVYKLGHAGDIKKVADGFGRNFLIPKGFAVLATAGALKKADQIREKANANRMLLNKEMSGLAEKVSALTLYFSSKAGETGKLYGSITTQMIVDAINKKTGITVDRHQVDVQPIRTLGEHKARVRLTVDLIPDVRIMVVRDGEAIVEETEEAAPAEESAAEAA